MNEVEALRRPFLIGVIWCAIAFIIVAGLIAIVVERTDDRPEGIAERWLTAVADLTRDGVHADAVDRVDAHGDVALGDQLVAGINADGKTAFEALEVGKARREGGRAFVPARVVARNQDGEHHFVVVLDQQRDSWRVTSVQPADVTLKVPSEGGAVASEAPLPLYAGALAVGVVVAAAASALVRLAGREADHLAAASVAHQAFSSS